MLLPVHILIVRITLGNYRVEPQSREARLWLVFLTVALKQYFFEENMPVHMTNTSTEIACLKLIFTKFVCSMKEVLVYCTGAYLPKKHCLDVQTVISFRLDYCNGLLYMYGAIAWCFDTVGLASGRASGL